MSLANCRCREVPLGSGKTAMRAATAPSQRPLPHSCLPTLFVPQSWLASLRKYRGTSWDQQQCQHQS
jgi:hypothetical protein